MTRHPNKVPVTVRGDFLYADKGLFMMVLCPLFIILMIFSADIYWKTKILYCLVLCGVTWTAWWSACDSCYYYHVSADKLVVKNRLSFYHKEFLVSEIESIAFGGYLSLGGLLSPRGNSINIKFREAGIEKHEVYHSANLNKANWILLIEALHSLGIKLEDPTGRFFKESGYSLPTG